MEGEEFRSQYAQKPYFYFLSSSKEISKNVIFIDIENIFIEIFCRIPFADNILEHSSCRIFTEFSAFACVIMHRNIMGYTNRDRINEASGWIRKYRLKWKF